MKKIPIAMFLVLLWMTTGCAVQVSDPPPMHTPQITASPTAVLATNTPPASPTVSLAPDLTATPGAPATTTPACPDPGTEPAADFLAPGTIIFLDYSKDLAVEDDRFYTFTSQDTSPRPVLEDLPPELLGPILTSPDRKWLSYYHAGDLILTTSDPTERIIIPGDTNKWIYGVYDWLADSQHFAALSRSQSDADAGLPETLIVFNPFTRKLRLVEPSFAYKFPVWFWERTKTHVRYSPTLTRVIYLEDAFTMVLWDIENGHEVWRLKGENLNIYPPVWSPDGAYLAFVHSSSINHIQVIDKDGNVIAPEIVAPGLITTFGWSPDGRYLTYWSDNAPKKNLRLFVFDLVTRQSFDTCIVEPDSLTLGSPPVWSPDSKQFIVGSLINPDAYFTEWRFHNLILDVIRNQVVQLDHEELEPVAWLRDE